MFVSETLFAFLIMMSHQQAWTASTQHKSYQLTPRVNENTERLSDQRRWSRSTFGIWPAAIRTLLLTTKEVRTNSPKYRKFVKTGNQDDATRDYKLLGPTYTSQKSFSFRGFVDDAAVKFSTNDRSQSGLPTILISDQKSGRVVKIVYQRPS